MSEFPEIAELVPHSGRMIVLDRMTAWADGIATCELQLKVSTTYVVDGHLDTITTIEHMAQSLAACLGYQAFRAGGGVRVGMVIASRVFEMDVPSVPVGQTLTVRVERVRGNDLLSHFNGTVCIDGKTISSATLTVYHADSPPGDS